MQNPATGLTETMDKICRIVILPEKYSDVRSAYEEVMLRCYNEQLLCYIFETKHCKISLEISFILKKEKRKEKIKYARLTFNQRLKIPERYLFFFFLLRNYVFLLRIFITYSLSFFFFLFNVRITLTWLYINRRRFNCFN